MTHPERNTSARAIVSRDGARTPSLAEAPELSIAFFSFALHFVWEFVQVPTYTGMAEMAHW